MKELAVGEVQTRLPKLLGTLEREPIVITQAGKVKAALIAMDEFDVEAYELARNPKFADIIHRSRQTGRSNGLVPLELLENELGLPPRPALKKRRPQKPKDS